jgi:hypothetical protein
LEKFLENVFQIMCCHVLLQADVTAEPDTVHA